MTTKRSPRLTEKRIREIVKDEMDAYVKTIQPLRTGESWSQEEDDQLRIELNDAMTTIALSHRRTVRAILYRIERNNLLDPGDC